MMAARTHPTVAAQALTLTVDTHLRAPADMPPALRRALIDRYTVPNPAYQEAAKYDRATADLDRHLRYWRATPDGGLALPRGDAEAAFSLAQEHGVAVTWENQTHQAPPVDFTEHLPLSTAQEGAVAAVLRRRMGVLVAPAGAGKTTMAMVAIARRRQPALFLVHTRELANQALCAAERVLGLDPGEVGMIAGGAWSIGDRLTIALVQSL